MSPHRRKNEKGIEEARAAIQAATHDLAATRARWPVVRALTRQAARVSAETHSQKVQNHLGDLFANALGEG